MNTERHGDRVMTGAGPFDPLAMAGRPIFLLRPRDKTKGNVMPKRKLQRPKRETLRFAALIRVSTEQQAKRGESLRTQQSQIEQAVESHGGRITRTYAGHEHATPGWERELVEKLLADSEQSRKPFDAVIVADPSRWSRDNVASETGLERLRGEGIRFFVLGTEYALFDEQARMFLAMASVMNQFQASHQKRKSVENCIARTANGIRICSAAWCSVWNAATRCAVKRALKATCITGTHKKTSKGMPVATKAVGASG